MNRKLLIIGQLFVFALIAGIIIVGAGQAGLSMGYWLRKLQRSFLLLEARPRIGESWCQRYDSLVLFTPRRYSALPGLALPGDPEGHLAIQIPLLEPARGRVGAREHGHHSEIASVRFVKSPTMPRPRPGSLPRFVAGLL